MKLIRSKDNSNYKELLKLSSSTRYRSKTGLTLLDGSHLLAAYLESGRQPRQIIINSASLQVEEIMTLVERVPETVPILQLDDSLYDALSILKTPTGLLAVIDLPLAAGNFIDFKFVLMLEAIQDPGNLGSIVRSAAAAGCDAVYLSEGCADVWSPKVLRAAMGGHFALNIFERQDLPGVIHAFSGPVLAASLQGEYSIYECDLQGRVAFLVGNEGAGLSGRLLGLATRHVKIPMPGEMESLNVAAATAVCLFETVRQQHQPPG